MDGAFCFKNGTQLSKLIDETSTLTRELDGTNHRAAVACLLRLALPHVNTMPPSENAVNEHGYARQILHSDPNGLFTVMALHWLPGACTPIHGHNAWGCVGVLEGEVGCETFNHRTCETQECVPEAPCLVSTGKLLAGPGTVATVDPDPCGIHRIFNPTQVPATTLHIYGMGLEKDPNALNKWYQH